MFSNGHGSGDGAFEGCRHTRLREVAVSSQLKRSRWHATRTKSFPVSFYGSTLGARDGQASCELSVTHQLRTYHVDPSIANVSARPCRLAWAKGTGCSRRRGLAERVGSGLATPVDGHGSRRACRACNRHAVRRSATSSSSLGECALPIHNLACGEACGVSPADRMGSQSHDGALSGRFIVRQRYGVGRLPDGALPS